MRIILLIIASIVFIAAEDSSQSSEPLKIGTREAAPFVIIEGDTYHGITIELLEELSREMEFEYELEERDIQGMLDGVRDGSLDVAASALTITSEREQFADFTHPFFVTGLGLAVPYETANPIWITFKQLISPEFLSVAGLLMLLLLGLGALVWLAERKTNEEEFGGTPAEGIGSGFWWSAVTMTTVGYGDKTPKTFTGRLLGFIWMFAGIMLISFFTATIASSLTVSQLESQVQGPADLPNVRVGILAGSATQDYMDENRIGYHSYTTLREGIQAVHDGGIDTFVHDAPILQYLVGSDFRNELRVLPNTFNRQYFGIALPAGSDLRDPMNQVILDFIGSEDWQQIQHRYLE